MSSVEYLKVKNQKIVAFAERATIQIERDRRAVMQIVFESTIEEAKILFSDSPTWGISLELDGDEVRYTDYSSYSVPMLYSDLCNGKVLVAMSSLTDMEQLLETLYGGVNNE